MLRLYASRVFRLRILAVKNWMKRRAARGPASAMSAGTVKAALGGQDDQVIFAVNHRLSYFPDRRNIISFMLRRLWAGKEVIFKCHVFSLVDGCSSSFDA